MVKEHAPAPERSLKQRMDALEEANRIRTYRAQAKRDLKAGRTTLFDLMQDPDCETMKLIDALLSLPKVGRVKANKVLQTARISPSKTIGGLSDRQRVELLGLVPPAPSRARPRLGAVAVAW